MFTVIIFIYPFALYVPTDYNVSYHHYYYREIHYSTSHTINKRNSTKIKVNYIKNDTQQTTPTKKQRTKKINIKTTMPQTKEFC